MGVVVNVKIENKVSLLTVSIPSNLIAARAIDFWNSSSTTSESVFVKLTAECLLLPTLTAVDSCSSAPAAWPRDGNSSCFSLRVFGDVRGCFGLEDHTIYPFTKFQDSSGQVRVKNLAQLMSLDDPRNSLLNCARLDAAGHIVSISRTDTKDMMVHVKFRDKQLSFTPESLVPLEATCDASTRLPWQAITLSDSKGFLSLALPSTRAFSLGFKFAVPVAFASSDLQDKNNEKADEAERELLKIELGSAGSLLIVLRQSRKAMVSKALPVAELRIIASVSDFALPYEHSVPTSFFLCDGAQARHFLGVSHDLEAGATAVFLDSCSICTFMQKNHPALQALWSPEELASGQNRQAVLGKECGGMSISEIACWEQPLSASQFLAAAMGGISYLKEYSQVMDAAAPRSYNLTSDKVVATAGLIRTTTYGELMSPIATPLMDISSSSSSSSSEEEEPAPVAPVVEVKAAPLPILPSKTTVNCEICTYEQKPASVCEMCGSQLPKLAAAPVPKPKSVAVATPDPAKVKLQDAAGRAARKAARVQRSKERALRKENRALALSLQQAAMKSPRSHALIPLPVGQALPAPDRSVSHSDLFAKDSVTVLPGDVLMVATGFSSSGHVGDATLVLDFALPALPASGRVMPLLQLDPFNASSTACVTVDSLGRVAFGGGRFLVSAGSDADGVRATRALVLEAGDICTYVLDPLREPTLQSRFSVDTRHDFQTFGVLCQLPAGPLVSATSNKFKVWSPERKCLRDVTADANEELVVRALLAVPEGLLVVIGPNADVYCTETWRKLRSFSGHSKQIGGAALFPDRRMFVTGSYDRTANVYRLDTDSSKPVLQYKKHTLDVNCVAVVAAGDKGSGLVRCCSGSDDKSVHVWNPVNGVCLHVLQGHSSGVHCITVLPGGRLATGSTGNNSEVCVWNAEQGGQPLQRFRHPRVQKIAFVSPEGLLSSGEDGARLWRLDQPTAPPIVLTQRKCLDAFADCAGAEQVIVLKR
jgi:hypothetical protein